MPGPDSHLASLRPHATALLVAVVSGLLLLGQARADQRRAVFGTIAQPMATIALRNGAVATTRVSVAEQQKHTSHERLIQGTNTQLWIVALPRNEQQAVYATLTSSKNSKVLNPLPGEKTHAWLVSADADTIQNVLDTHSFASAALFPPALKLSPGLSSIEKAPDGSMPVSLVAATAGLEDTSVPALLEAMKKQIATLAPGARAEVEAVGNNLRVTVPAKDAMAVAKWLATLAEVTWVDRQMRAQLHG